MLLIEYCNHPKPAEQDGEVWVVAICFPLLPEISMDALFPIPHYRLVEKQLNIFLCHNIQRLRVDQVHNCIVHTPDEWLPGFHHLKKHSRKLKILFPDSC